MMVSVCARENDARAFPTLASVFLAQCRQLSSMILYAGIYVYVIFVTQILQVHRPFFVKF
jgi:hypothetical protein